MEEEKGKIRSTEDVRKVILEEYKKCKLDPVYFMNKYVFVQHPKRGRVLFNLYPFQSRVLRLLKSENNSIILKSRQLGISTLVAAYSLWLMLFHKDKNILALATTQSTARNLVTKVIFAYDELPKWLQLPFVEKNKLSLRLKNGSRIIAKSSSPDAARSEAVSLLVLDEAAFIPDISETYAAAQQTLATGGQCIALSTPNGTGNWFHQMWQAAEMGENSFTPIKLPWKVHPERDEKWREEQDADLGPRLASQECDASFLTSGETVLEPEDLLFYEQNLVEEPLEKRGIDANFWVWKPADYSLSYVVVADVARGDGADYSAFHVFELESVEQVAEYKGKIGPRDFGNVLVGVATEYNNALLVVENANIGWATIEQILERNYNNLYYSSNSNTDTVESYISKLEREKLTPGFTTSTAVRPLLVAKLIEYVRERSVIVKSKRTLGELRVFIWKAGKAQAQSGYNDDLTMALSIFLFVRDTAIRMRQQGLDLTRAQLSSFTSLNKKNYDTVTTSHFPNFQNPYLMKVRENVQEDISWLLK